MLEPVCWAGRLQAAGVACLRWPLHALASALLWPKVRRQLSGGQLAYPDQWRRGDCPPHRRVF
jgi:long-chain acyl-CoA synthetase